PLPISQLIRLAGRRQALANLERILAQGEPSPEELALVQQLLEDEESQPLFLVIARGARAYGDQALQQMDQDGRHLDIPNGFLPIRFPGDVLSYRAKRLLYMTKLVEAAKLPYPEQTERVAQALPELRNDWSWRLERF